MVEWDVLVIGAGPAGSRAAEAAAKEGAKVLVVEKMDEVGIPVQCAEFLHRKVVEELGLPQDVMVQDVHEMVTYINGKEEARTRSPGVILDRAAFDSLLARRAVDAGAELRTGTWAVDPVPLGDRIVGAKLSTASQQCSSVDERGKVIIGADGPMSIVGTWIGASNKEMLVANQATVELRQRSEVTEVYLDPGYPGGYGWLFPRGEVANVGVGVDRSLGMAPKEALDRLIRALGDRIGGRVRAAAGHIPVGGPVRSDMDNVMLVGDAGGFTHPITGGGIHQAVETGRSAGKAAAKVDLDAFEKEWEPLFGRSLSHAIERRRMMVVAWRRAAGDREEFLSLMKRTWIAFKEYNR